MANIEGSGMGGSRPKPLSKLEQQGYVQKRPPAYTPPKQTYVNPSPANQISKANAANPYNPPPPHVNPSPANQISKANAANPYNPPPPHVNPSPANQISKANAANPYNPPPPHVNPPPANQISKANAANPYNPPPVNNTAQQQAILAAQREAERQALLEAQRRAQEEAARRAQEEAARQAAIAAQQEAERRAREEAARRAREEAARQAAIAAQRAQEERDRQATLAAQQQRDRLNAIVSQQKSTHENKKLEQINTSPTNKQSATYYWNIANVPTKYVNPVVANEISKANVANPYNPPQSISNEAAENYQYNRQKFLEAERANNAPVNVSNLSNEDRIAYLAALRAMNPEPQRDWGNRAQTVNMTPGLANVENINIPASTTVPNTASAAPAASTAAPLSSATAYPELYRYRTTNLNTAGYTSTAPAAGTIEKSTGTANEAVIPKGAKKSRPSYGQSGQVVKAPYKVGGYTAAELKAMGNEARKDLVGPGGSMLFEGYYKAPDGRYYPVDQGKANYALARGMTDPSQYWYYYGYTPDKEAYRNVFGTYYGYTPSWRTTAYSNASGAGPVPAPKYAPSVPAPSGSTGAYGAGFSGVDITGQQRYFNPVINWSY